MQSNQYSSLIIEFNEEAQSYLEWKPDSNTVAYYPFTSETTTNDMKTSGTKYNLNVNKNITFGNYQGANCAYGNSANYYSGLRYTGSTQIIPNQNFTWSCWIYLINTSTDNPRLCSSLGGNPYGVLINNSGKIVCWTTSSTNGFQMQTGSWHMYTVVGSFTSGSYK